MVMAKGGRRKEISQASLHRFIRHDRHGIGQVDRSAAGRHRNADACFRNFAEPDAFGSEKEDIPVLIRKIAVGEVPARIDAHKPSSSILLEKGSVIGDRSEPDLFPVIHSRPADPPVIQRVSQGPDEDQFDSKRHGKPRDIAGVLRNFGLDEGDGNHHAGRIPRP